MSGVLTMILAGGEGTRLAPLTGIRAKPAVPFGGNYRIIDFVLNNFVNSDLLQIFVITQFKSHSLMKHLSRAWRVTGLTNRFIDPIPAQMQTGKHWYLGTADAVYQNLHLIHGLDPEHVCVFGGDHIYKMDYRQMLAFHLAQQTDVSIAAVQVPLTLAHQFGILKADAALRICQFSEKPSAKTAQGFTQHNSVLASMGNYLFSAQALYKVLDPLQAGEACDFGHDIIPALVAQGRASAYPFHHNSLPTKQSLDGYWRDVGTLAALFHSKLDVMQHEDWLDSPSQPWPILAGCSKPSLCNKTLRQIKKVCQPAVPLYASLQ